MLTKRLSVPAYRKPDLLSGRFPAGVTLTLVFYWHGCICEGGVILPFPFSFPM